MFFPINKKDLDLYLEKTVYYKKDFQCKVIKILNKNEFLVIRLDDPEPMKQNCFIGDCWTKE